MESRKISGGSPGRSRRLQPAIGFCRSPTRKNSFSVACDQAAFTNSLAPRFHRQSLARLEAALTEGYECVPLGQLAQIKRGARGRRIPAGWDPYIRTSSIINYGTGAISRTLWDCKTYQSHRQKVGPGDILLTIEGKIGAVALLGNHERCLIKNHVEFIPS